MNERRTHKRIPIASPGALAVTLGFFLTLFFLCTAKYGVSAPDESFYYTVVQRLLLGERLIADEWNVAQLVHLLNLLPGWLFIRLTGDTEGMILCMRYLFIAVNTVFYAYLCRKLRFFGYWGVLAAFSFSAVILQTIFAITYFTAAPMAVLAFGMVLMIDDNKKSPPKLLFAGVLLACAVLAEPYLLAGFLLWAGTVFVYVLLKKKSKPVLRSYGFLMRGRVFLWVSAGAVGVFIPFMLYMICSGAFDNFSNAFPYLTSGAEVGLLGSVLLKKTGEACTFFGIPFVAGLTAAVIAAAVLRIKKSGSVQAKRIVFVCACLCLAGSCAYAGIKTACTPETAVRVYFTEYHGFTFLLFSPVLWLLCDKNDPRLIALWLTGASFSLLVDASSAVILASGCGIVRVAAVLQLSELLPQLRERKAMPERKKKNTPPFSRKRAGALYRSILGISAAAVIVWHGCYVLAQTVYKPYEKLILNDSALLSCRLTEGPLKGLYTTEHTGAVYAATLQDLNEIKHAANGAPVTVPALAPYTYLYMALPYGSYSAWFEYYETDRLAAYWQLRPEQQPAYVYIPYYENGLFAKREDGVLQLMLDRLFEWIDGNVTEGKAGYIVEVMQIRSPFAEIPEA